MYCKYVKSITMAAHFPIRVFILHNNKKKWMGTSYYLTKAAKQTDMLKCCMAGTMWSYHVIV